jgi:hypothetical protein
MKAKVTATTSDGREYPIGVFTHGICIEDDAIIDMASRDPVLARWGRAWASAASIAEEMELEPGLRSSPTPLFTRVFIQGVNEF